MNKKIIGILSGLAAAAIWGGMYVVSKVVLDVIPPFSLIALRLILGGLALGIVVLLRPREPMSRPQFWQEEVPARPPAQPPGFNVALR